MASSPSGNIQQKPLPDILEDLRQGKATGTLTVMRGTVAKCICLKGGRIVFATSTDVHDRLSEVLVKTGKVTKKNMDDAVSLYKKGGGLKKLGAVLVENGFIAPKELFGGLKNQVKEIIYSIFLWNDGEYKFEERLPPDFIQLQINFQELISEIIARIKHEMPA
ncbi:MAG TPA: DUF4388 domain-containing protein [Nitrospirota bacterium]|nr:DUF4388 domain-containing protein [Nitrospirota bacterium]